MAKINPNLARLLACLASGVLLLTAQSLNPVWPAAWIAAAPVLAAAFLSRRSTGFLLAFAAGLIGAGPLFVYLLDVAPLPIAVVIAVLVALGFSGGVSIAARARRSLPSALAVFAFPAWTAGLETVIAHVSPHGTSGGLSYSQMDFLPVLQVASLGGPAAVTFLVTLFASALAFIVADFVERRRDAGAMAAAAAVLVAGLGFGAWRLESAPAAPAIPVAVAALDFPRQLPSDWRAVLAAYRPRLDEAAAKGVRLLVLPEEIAAVSSADIPAIRAELGGYATRSHMTLAVGFRVAEDKVRNRLLVFTPDGRMLAYDKRHPIPGLETLEVTASTNPVLSAQVQDLKLGGAICKDFDFIETGRSLAADGARIVVAPAWDFGTDAWVHGRMAMLPAVEDGFTLVRSARRGIMSVTDRYGRVLAEAPSGPNAPLLVAQAPVPQAGPTLYSRIGDVFGWACAAAAAGFMALGRRLRETKA